MNTETLPVPLQEKDHALDVVKLTDKDFLRSLENAVRYAEEYRKTVAI